MEQIKKIIEKAQPWFFDHGLKIIIIIGVAYLVRSFAGIFIDKTIRKIVVPNHVLSRNEEKKREDTLIRIFKGGLRIAVVVIAGLMVLSEAGVNIGPLLAGAGIAGLAFGFGGQYLIKDLISGFFIILENQYRVGDVVCFDGVCGLVEDVSLRMTTLRDLDGTVHNVPHGYRRYHWH